ncbi:biotin transporter BioY [Wenjunlia tyrosinilytica]|uniref:Biotin transporter BioY n=1 Tax=Wenjunlia tyrosinilytica TaxID=1544741 RepID=A0A917ZTR8_9ACTN|nr:biotin transporter BioY [Wenjunlia tyrosinilytica]
MSSFKSFRGARLRLGPLTVLAGGAGAGKSNALEALAVLGQLANGETVSDALRGVRGGAAACVPLGVGADVQGRRGIRIGCTVDGRLGPVRLELAVQVEPELRIVGERMTGAGEVLLETALRDPRRRSVQAAWHTAGLVPVTRAPLPDDRLASALLPLRVAGKTQGQRLVLDAAEQLVVGLRGVFGVDPAPGAMRGWVAARDGLLHPSARNVSAVVGRTENECRIRHGLLGDAMRALCPYPVERVTAVRGESGNVMAAVDRGRLGLMPVELMGEGELRALAFALVLLTGPGILAMDVAEVPDALQLLTVLAHDVDRGLDRRQVRELLALAGRMCERGHVRVVATAHAGTWVEDLPGVTLASLPLG